MNCKNCKQSKSEHFQFYPEGNLWCTDEGNNNQVFEMLCACDGRWKAATYHSEEQCSLVAPRLCGHGVPVERCPALPAVELPPLRAAKERGEDWSNFWKRVAEEREEQLRAALKGLATAQRIANNALDRAERLMPR